MENKYRLHTPEELQKIALEDFERFKEISKYYYDNDFDFFESDILPIIEIHKLHHVSSNVDKINTDVILLDQCNINSEICKVSPSPIKIKGIINRKLIIYGVAAFLLFITTVLLYYILIFNDNYRQGVRLLKDKKYDLALQKFSQLDSNSEKYNSYIPAITFTKASKYFEEQDYRLSITYYKAIPQDSEFFEEAKLQIDKISNDPNIIYFKSINHIKAKEYDDAINELQRVKVTDPYYSKAQSKIMYVKGILDFNLGNYESADTYFQGVEKSDEFYSDIISKQSIITNFLNNKRDGEANKDYARRLIEIADDIEDEHQLSNNGTFLYIKNTYIPRLISLRSQLNSTYYGATNKNSSLTDFKGITLKWVNSYIDYAEDICTYGYYVNYDADRMWSKYGYTLYSKKDLGTELHQKVIKKYKEIQTQFILK